MNKLTHIALTLIAACTLLAACNNGGCYENGSSLPLASFYVGPKQATVTGLTVMGIGVPGDSLLADNAAMKEMYLPLRANATTTSYHIGRWVTINNVRTELKDTITFEYEAVPFFHSEECGAMYNFDIRGLHHTTRGIDSIVMITNTITNLPAPSMKIYFTDFQ